MPQTVDTSLWVYVPTKGVSIVFAVLFAVSGALHIWQNNIKYRSWRIGFLLPWAALLFVAGFVLREYGAYHYNDLPIYVASLVLIFCAPPVYAGANYFIFGRLLYYIPYLSLLHPGRVWTTFVALDTVVEILSAQGASRAVNSNNTPAERLAGLDLVKASLFLQIALFVTFVALVVQFHIRCVRAGVFSRNCKIIVYELYASSCFILLRNAFRIATFYYSYDSYTNATEWLFWTFEVLPMTLTTYLFNVWPPGKYLPPNNKTYLAADGKTEMEGPGAADTRHWLLTVFDPFDIGGLIAGRDKKNRFWEEDGIGGPTKAESGPISTVA